MSKMLRWLALAALVAVGLPINDAQAAFNIARPSATARQQALASIQSAGTSDDETVEEVTKDRPFTVDFEQLGVDNPTNAYLLIVNEKNGNMIALAAGDSESSKLELTPLALAEMEMQYLGANQKYRCMTMCCSVSGNDEQLESRMVGSAVGQVDLPNFNYVEDGGSTKTTTTAQRRLISIDRKSLCYTMMDPADQEQISVMNNLEKSEAYYTYVYELPNGSYYVYDEMTKLDDDVHEEAVVFSGLNFKVSVYNVSNVKNATSEQVSKAIQYACQIWGNAVQGSCPVQMYINFRPSSYFSDYRILANSATPPSVAMGKRLYVSTLANQIAGNDSFPSNYDVTLNFNSAYFDSSWTKSMYGVDATYYMGIDKKGGSYQQDFVTVLIHEICHGMGFAGNILYNPYSTYHGCLFWVRTDGTYVSEYPSTYTDCLTYNGEKVANLSKANRVKAITSDNLYWSGANVMAVNGGTPVKMFAPTTYQSGSSVSHWDDSVMDKFKLFMSWQHHYAWHEVSALESAAMKDIGWTLANDSTKPTAPTGVSATQGTQVGKVTVSWKAVSGASSYTVYRSTSSSGSYSSIKSGLVSLSYDDSTVSGTTKYYYKVAAVNDAGTGAQSAYVMGYAKTAPTLKAIEISGPATLNAGAYGDYSLKATYSDGSTATVTSSATWTLATGSSYASLDKNRLTAGAVTGSSRNVTLRATYGGLTADYNITILPKTVTVTFVPGSYGTASFTSRAYVVDAAYGTLPTVAKTANNRYQFVGWYTAASGGSKVTTATLASGNVTKLYAHWSYLSVYSDLRLEAPSTVACGSSVTVKCYVKRDGEEVQVTPARWETCGTGGGLSYSLKNGVMTVTASATATGSMTLKAFYDELEASATISARASTVTVSFDAQGGTVSPSSKTYTVGSAYGSLPTPTKTAHTFDGWYTAAVGGTKVTESTICTTSVTKLYARWTYNPTLVSISISGSSNVSSGGTRTYTCTATYNDGTQQTVSPSWSTTKGSITSAGVLTAPGVTSETTLTITAAYNGKTATKIVTVAPKTVTVAFDAQGGSASFTSRSYTVGAAYGTLPTATRSGNWTFLGWFTSTGEDGVKVTEETIAVQSVTKLSAAWQQKIVIERLVIGGSSTIASGSSETYTCTAYYSDGTNKAVTPTWSIVSGTAHVTLSAGTITAKTTTVNRAVVIGASYGGLTATKSITIVPKKVTVTFNANGGSVSPSSQQYTVGLAYGSFPPATRNGYRFIGWFTTASAGTQMSESTLATESVATLFAHWQENPPAIKEVKLTGGASSITAGGSTTFVATAYYTNGVTSTSENLGSKATWTVSNPSAGSVNAGTFTAKQVTEKTVTTITASYEGKSATVSITVNPEEVTVSFNANGGSVSPSSQKFVVGAVYGMLPTPSYDEDHAFEGWFTLAEGGRPISAGSVCEKLVTALYAHWKESTHVVSLAITGPLVVTGGVESAYACRATYSDDSEKVVTPTWALDDAKHGAISEDGVFLPSYVVEETNITISASYEGKAAQLVVTVEPTIVSIRFDPQNGAVNPQRMEFIVGDVYGDLPVPVRSGYVFDGWWTGASKSGEQIDAACTVSDDIEILYAGWKKTSSVLTGIEISGPEKVMSGGFAVYSCKAVYADGTTGDVVPTWSLSFGLSYATMRVSGMLTALATDVERSVTVLATYYEGGVRYEDTFAVKIVPQTLAISPSTFSIESGAQICELLVSATGSWTVETDADWIRLAKTSGKSIDTVSFSVTANADTEERTGTITVRSGDIVETSVVKQYSPIPDVYVTVTLNTGVPGQAATTRQYLLGRKFGYLPTPVREGYAFGGWWTGSNGTGMRVHSMTVVTNDKLTLYGYWTGMTAAYALNNALDWVEDASNPWTFDYITSVDRKVGMTTPALGNGEKSELSALVEGPGTLSFYWKTSSEEYFDTLTLYVDGKFKANISGQTGWLSKAITITGYGQHVLTWQYSKDGRGASGADCAWLDLVTWCPDYAGVASVQSAASGNSVPESWLNSFGIEVTTSTPDEDTDGDGMTNYQEYKAGTDPTDAESCFKVYLEMGEDGKPVLDVLSGKAYILEGKANLTDEKWESADADAHHFFRARIVE